MSDSVKARKPPRNFEDEDACARACYHVNRIGKYGVVSPKWCETHGAFHMSNGWVADVCRSSSVAEAG